MSFWYPNKYREPLQSRIVAISDEVGLVREKSSNLYAVDFWDGSKWSLLNGEYEPYEQAKRRAETYCRDHTQERRGE